MYALNASSVADFNPRAICGLQCVRRNHAADAKDNVSSSTVARMAFFCVSSGTSAAVELEFKSGRMARTAGRLYCSAYGRMKLNIIIFRVPCPGLPGKTFTSNTKFPDSNAISAKIAACSPRVIKPNFENDLLINGAI